MKFSDTVIVKGYLRVQVFDAKTGKELWREEKNNLICQNTRLSLTRLLAQQAAHTVEHYRIWSIYVGDGSTAPATTQTSLQGSNIFGKAVTQEVTIISPADSGILEMDTTLAAGDHNEEWLRECALYTRGSSDSVTTPPNGDARMLARQIHGAIYKTSGITVKYTWRYQITA